MIKRIFDSNSFKLILIGVILVVAALLRLYKLGEIPNGLYVDEAAIGYNSYSFLKTGKDEFGKAWPIFLRSYEAYAPILYTYVSMLPVSLLGLTIYAVRLTSTVSGILTVLFVYLIIKKIDLLNKRYIPEITAGIIAFSPWTLFFSRGAYEANLAILILLIAIYLFLLARKEKWFLILSFVLLSISTYAYQAERVVSFLIIASYILVYLWDDLKRKILSKELIISVVLFLAIQSPQLLLATKPAFSQRASGLFYKDRVIEQSQKIKLPKVISYPLSFSRELFSNALSYLSPNNLFWKGDSDFQRSTPELAPFYFWMVIPYFIGLYVFFLNFKNKDIKFISLLGASFIIVPSLTKDPFSTLRSLPLVLPISIVITLGIDWLCTKGKIFCLGVALLGLLSLVFLWRSYFVLLPYERAKLWGYGVDKLAAEIKLRPSSLFVIDESRQKPIYISLAYFIKLDPKVLPNSVDQSIRENYYSNIKFDSNYRFQNIEIRGIKWEEDIYKDQIIVGDELSVSKEQMKEHFLTQVFEILDPTGETLYRGYQTNPREKCLATNFESIYCKGR